MCCNFFRGAIIPSYGSYFVCCHGHGVWHENLQYISYSKKPTLHFECKKLHCAKKSYPASIYPLN